MTPNTIATEDQLSEAVILRVMSEVPTPHFIQHKLGRTGNGYLRSRMRSWYQMVQQQVVVVLTDVDRANCVVDFRAQWLATAPPENLVFGIAAREVESRVLADHDAMRCLIGPRGVLPPAPDSLADPKQALLGLAKSASKNVGDGLFKVVDGNLTQGLGYNARLTAWIQSEWCPTRAQERSPSLERARLRLNDAVRAFVYPPDLQGLNRR